MKKFSWILALLAALAVVFVGVGCGGGDDPEGEKGLATDVVIKGIVHDATWTAADSKTMQLQGFGDAIECDINATDKKWELEVAKGTEVALKDWMEANTKFPFVAMTTTKDDGEGGAYAFTITDILFGEDSIKTVLEAATWAEVLTKGKDYFGKYEQTGATVTLAGTADGIVVTRTDTGKYRNNNSITIDLINLAKLASGGEVEAPDPNEPTLFNNGNKDDDGDLGSAADCISKTGNKVTVKLPDGTEGDGGLDFGVGFWYSLPEGWATATSITFTYTATITKGGELGVKQGKGFNANNDLGGGAGNSDKYLPLTAGAGKTLSVKVAHLDSSTLMASNAISFQVNNYSVAEHDFTFEVTKIELVK